MSFVCPDDPPHLFSLIYRDEKPAGVVISPTKAIEKTGSFIVLMKGWFRKSVGGKVVRVPEDLG